MKTYIIGLLALFILVVSPAFAQKSYTELEKKFIKSVDDAEFRIDKMRSTGELQNIQYEDEQKVVRKAKQLKELLEEGHDVDEQMMKDWIDKLNRLGVSKEKEGEGVQLKPKKKKKTDN